MIWSAGTQGQAQWSMHMYLLQVQPMVIQWCSVLGIGREFASQFASLGFGLVLLDRDIEGLNNVQTELIEKYGVNIQLVHSNLSRLNTVRKYKELLMQVEDLDI